MDDDIVRAAILDLCMERGQGKTICPSEAARRAAGDGGDWRSLMGPVRQVAVELSREGQISIYRKGRPIEPAQMRGVIRLGLPGKTVRGSG
jgi:hypothetical protein